MVKLVSEKDLTLFEYSLIIHKNYQWERDATCQCIVCVCVCVRAMYLFGSILNNREYQKTWSLWRDLTSASYFITNALFQLYNYHLKLTFSTWLQTFKNLRRYKYLKYHCFALFGPFGTELKAASLHMKHGTQHALELFYSLKFFCVCACVRLGVTISICL